MSSQLSRRDFLKATVAGTASLLVGLNAQGLLAAGGAESVLNPFVRIDPDGTVTVIIKHFEMGQGTTTGLATLLAEEMDADWETLRTEYAPSDNEKYKNLLFGAQGTGGSTAIANSFTQYRNAGATARDLLIRAAAQTWKVDEESITVERGKLRSGSRESGFGEFVALAATLQPWPEPKLKRPEQFNLIGKVDLPRKDNHDKTDGSAIFAMDVQLPGMVYAVILRSPRFGGVLTGFDTASAKQVAGFIDARALPTKNGLVVYGKNSWAALKGREAIKAEWDFSQAERRNSDEMRANQQELVKQPQFQARKEVATPDATRAVTESSQQIEAEFSFPFLAHAPMEPLVCVIEPTTNGVLLHDGCQFPAVAHGALSQVLKLKPEQVEIKTLYAGGSFGRRATPAADYQVEAAFAFSLLGGKAPVKTMWSREDDLHGGFYRPMAHHRVAVGLDQEGKIVAWDHRVATKSIFKGTAFESATVHDGIDHSSVEGVADTLYSIPNMAVGLSDFQSSVPVLWWRSVGHTHTGYAMESMLDMVAHATRTDPIALRLSMLDTSKLEQRRLAGTIKAVRDLSKWQPGQKRGFACHYSFRTFVAVVADVSVDGNRVHVDKLHIAVDCGVAVNPDVIRAQMEGGAGFGLGAMLRNEITFKDGQVVENNFPDYKPLRMPDMPTVEVTIVSSNEAPTGVGEPAVPPTGPAVANAIFAVTGKRITELPMTRSGFVFA